MDSSIKQRWGRYLVYMVIVSALLTSVGSIQALADGQPGTSGQIEIEINEGPSYINRGWFFIFPFKKGPQIAAWAEDGNGRYIGTIIVSGKTAEKKWISAPDEGRPESLPVWSEKSGGCFDPADTVTAASLNSGKTKTGSHFTLTGGRYKVYLEVNLSYDWNSVWAKNLPEDNPLYNGVNGQPSLVYCADLDYSQGPAEVKMIPVGTGDPRGRNGAITESLEGLDTALSILDSAYVRIR